MHPAPAFCVGEKAQQSLAVAHAEPTDRPVAEGRDRELAVAGHDNGPRSPGASASQATLPPASYLITRQAVPSTKLF